ncbi:MAG: agmatinase [Candidatus Melainabacteria bacterium]|nr:MAG: agmatinase [Candidatus Melainabacteria bacterium]
MPNKNTKSQKQVSKSSARKKPAAKPVNKGASKSVVKSSTKSGVKPRPGSATKGSAASSAASNVSSSVGSTAAVKPAMPEKSKKLPNFLGLPENFSSPENSKVMVIPVPYEATTSYGQGTSRGPAAILEASQQVELFDDELWEEPFKIGIHTTAAIEMKTVDRYVAKPFEELYDTVKQLVAINKFPLILGGEHSLTVGAVKACAEQYKDLSILQIDAHCDLRPEYEGNPYSHASVSYQLYHLLPKPLITQVGIRNVSAEEVKWLETEYPNVNIYWARQQERWNFQEIINTLSDNVYLTIDVDGLDPSIMPATGTPEPGGINWYQLMELVKLVCVKRNVVGADIVELSPIPGFHAPDFLVAKLAYKLIGYRFALDLGVTKRYV